MNPRSGGGSFFFTPGNAMAAIGRESTDHILLRLPLLKDPDRCGSYEML